MTRLFGTDGVRGLANDLLTPALAVQLGEAAARVLTRENPASNHSRSGRPRAIVGRDTRASGEFLDHAISAGLASSGVDVTRVGVLPTPAIAHLTATQDIDLGVMISASHNPFQDNGIKFFARGGLQARRRRPRTRSSRCWAKSGTCPRRRGRARHQGRDGRRPELHQPPRRLRGH